MRCVIVFALFVVSAIYLINPTAGFFEILPDNLPIIGNLDEAGAVAIVLNCFRLCGLDLTNLFSKPLRRKRVYQNTKGIVWPRHNKALKRTDTES